MIDLVPRAIAYLKEAGVSFAPGLSALEITRIEDRFGFSFSVEHREFLTTMLPISRGWVNWRTESADALRERLNRPIDGTIFDVHNNDFWPASWGKRPTEKMQIEQQARMRLGHVPKLVPIYGHRYLPAAPAPTPSPVFSVYQTDVIYYGADLLDYVSREFGPSEPRWSTMDAPRHVEFWSNLASGADNADL
jgi:hypothetical protein